MKRSTFLLSVLAVTPAIFSACTPAATPTPSASKDANQSATPAKQQAGDAKPQGTPAKQQAAAGYARSELLAETDWLAEHLDDPNIRVVDMRAADAYKAGHIKNAVHLTFDKLKDSEDKLHVVNEKQVGPLMESLGIGDDTLVVAYDNQGGLGPARLWWVLDYYGHTKMKILNGGWNKWTKEGRSTVADEPKITPAKFTPKVNPNVICGISDVKNAIDQPDFVIVDARSAAEYAGTDVRAKRGGHIPSAVNIDWQRNVTNDDLKVFKPADELLKMYESAGVTKDKKIIAHCQTAVRSAHTLFTLRLIGYEMLQNYDGSWAEWGNDESLPVTR